ncbi:MAG TPA: HNH endonuclease [Rubrobacter sp.]|nr:HNH endonuclease [Rubrobacter sp.]
MDRETYAALIETEWGRFLAASWEREEAPSDEAWRAHLRQVGRVYVHAAHRLLGRAAEPEFDSLEADEEACNEIVAYVNGRLRYSVSPWLPDEVWQDGEDDDVSAAWKAREEQLQAMTYAEYLASPEWAEQRNRAIRRAGGRCQTCGRGQRLHVHHRTYGARREERADDLIVLCEDCHLAVHVRGGSHTPKRLRR